MIGKIDLHLFSFLNFKGGRDIRTYLDVLPDVTLMDKREPDKGLEPDSR